MPKSDLDTRLQDRIGAFVTEINALVREAAVEAVQEALAGDGAPARRSAPRRTRRKARGKVAKRGRVAKRGKRVRRTGAQVEALAGKALTAIRREPGRRLGEIAKELRAKTKDVRRPVQTLLDAKKVRTTGVRGGTRYFPAGGGAAKPRRTAKRKTRKGKKTKGA